MRTQGGILHGRRYGEKPRTNESTAWTVWSTWNPIRTARAGSERSGRESKRTDRSEEERTGYGGRGGEPEPPTPSVIVKTGNKKSRRSCRDFSFLTRFVGSNRS